MLLTITRYLDLDTDVAGDRLADAVPGALTDSATRVGRSVAHLDHADHDSASLSGGGTLDGTVVRISRLDRLAAIEVTVPWSETERETTALAADTFAGSLTRRLLAA